jgi:flavin reductase (DIM6/NTAB) family NADH-FMN oxidoreductase RutF
MDIDSIGAALGKIPSGVFIATSSIDGDEVGMLASFVEQAGFNPPAITAAIGVDRRLNQAIEESGMIGINILGEEDGRLMKPFNQQENHSPFTSLELDDNEFNLPQLTEALAFLACKITGKIEGGDHTIYAAEVLDGILNDPSSSPMVRVRKNGFQY